MKPIIEITNMLEDFLYQKLALRTTLPILIVVSIRSQSKKIEALAEQLIPLKEPSQKLEDVMIRTSIEGRASTGSRSSTPIRLNQKQPKRKFQGRNLAFLIAGLMSCSLQSGCTGSTYSNHFDCPMGQGAGCASISRVNKLIDRHEIDLGNDDAPFSKSSDSSEASAKQHAGKQGVGTRRVRGQIYVYYGPDQLSRLIPIIEEDN
jgi:hypothetical protein